MSRTPAEFTQWLKDYLRHNGEKALSLPQFAEVYTQVMMVEIPAAQPSRDPVEALAWQVTNVARTEAAARLARSDEYSRWFGDAWYDVGLRGSASGADLVTNQLRALTGRFDRMSDRTSVLPKTRPPKL